MCFDQKELFASINAQTAFVRYLISDLKEDLFSIQKIKRVCPHLFGMLMNIELAISKIPILNYANEEDCEMPDDWEEMFAQRSYEEILGIEDTGIDSEMSDLNSIQQQKLPKPRQKVIMDASSMARGPYRSYNTQEKLNVVRLHREGRSYASISKLLKIPQKNIVRWCKSGIHRKEGAGRKIGDVEMERKVLNWIEKQQLKGKQICGKDIRKKAMDFSTKQDFKSSKGWFKNFMRRHSMLGNICKQQAD